MDASGGGCVNVSFNVLDNGDHSVIMFLYAIAKHEPSPLKHAAVICAHSDSNANNINVTATHGHIHARARIVTLTGTSL